MPNKASEVTVSDLAIATITNQVAQLAPEYLSVERGGASIEAKQACYLPVGSAGGEPVVGKLKGEEHVFVGAGHSCWGIQNGESLCINLFDSGTSVLVADLFCACCISRPLRSRDWNRPGRDRTQWTSDFSQCRGTETMMRVATICIIFIICSARSMHLAQPRDRLACHLAITESMALRFIARV